MSTMAEIAEARVSGAGAFLRGEDVDKNPFYRNTATWHAFIAGWHWMAADKMTGR